MTAKGLPPVGRQALAGVKVLELGQLIAGPFAGKTLGDFGAEVIKIEPPGVGDPLRKWRLLHDGTSVWWQVSSRNKQSVTLDLRVKEGQDVMRRLAAEADIRPEVEVYPLEDAGRALLELKARRIRGAKVLRIS